MNSLKIDQKDFKVILGVAGILPVMCFIGGYYLGTSGPARLENSGNSAELPMAEHDASVSGPLEKAGRDGMQKEIRLVNERDHGSGLSGEYKGVEDDTVQSAAADDRPGTSPADSELKHTVPSVSLLKSFKEYLVQAGRFSSYENAVKFQARLMGKNLSSRIALDENDARPAFLIIVSSFATRDEAKRYCLFAETFYHLDFYVKAREGNLQNPNGAFASL